MAKLIILRGYPGSGKTTIGKTLEAEGLGRFVDHNAILTFIANITGNDDGIYEDIANLELAITRKLLQDGSSVIVARGFSSLASMKPYEDIARLLQAEVKIIRLTVDEQQLADRVQSSERLNDFNPTVTPESLRAWVQENPLIDHSSELIVDNDGLLEETVDQITQYM